MDRFESRVFSTETLGAGMTALASQQVKSELPEDKDAMLRELKDFKGFFWRWQTGICFGIPPIAPNLFG